MEKGKLINEVWIMRTKDCWYPIQISDRCKPEDHGSYLTFNGVRYPNNRNGYKEALDALRAASKDTAHD